MPRQATNRTLELVPYPSVPLEDIYVRHTFWRGLHSKHTRDLLGVFVTVLAATVSVMFLIKPLSPPEIWGSQVLAAVVTSGLAAFAAIFQLAKLRFSTVDVFSSEILARLRIMAADGSLRRLVMYGDPLHVRLRQEQAETRPLESVLEPSKENYFENFFKRSSDLGALSSIVVDHVTDFYSFLMASRDALRDLKATIDTFPNQTDEINARVTDVIFMIDLVAYSGLRALEELIETPAHQLHSRQIALCVGTHSSAFLADRIGPTDLRYEEVSRRRAQYVDLTNDLKARIRQPLIGRGAVPRGVIAKGSDFF